MPKQKSRAASEIAKPFNPLEKKHLGESVAAALLAQEKHDLPLGTRSSGAGLYALYYAGDHQLYQLLLALATEEENEIPIYVGKAIPAGGRKGGLGLDVPAGQVLYKRINEHAESISHTKSLNLKDFFCRYLVADDIWIPLGESLLIEKFAPLWNRVIDGFGNHDPGAGRYQQQKSPWDTLHEGRPWADRLNQSKKTADAIRDSVVKHFAEIERLRKNK